MEFFYYFLLFHAFSVLVVGALIYFFAKSKAFKISGVVAVVISLSLFLDFFSLPSLDERRLLMDQIIHCSSNNVTAIEINPSGDRIGQRKSLVVNTIRIENPGHIDNICQALAATETTIFPWRSPYTWRCVLKLKYMEKSISVLIVASGESERLLSIIDVKTNGELGTTLALLKSNSLGAVLENIINQSLD